MKHYVNLYISFLFIFSVFTLTNSSHLNHFIQAAETEPTKIISSLTIPSKNSIWKAIEQIGTEMEFAEIVKGTRQLIESKFDSIAKLNPSQPLGVAVATNGNDIFVFAFLPLRNNEVLTDDKLTILKDSINTQINIPFEIDLVVKNSTLFITQSKFRELLPNNANAVFKTENIKDETQLFDLVINFEKIPREFMEAGLATFRQKLAEQTSASSESLKSQELLLAYYSNILNSLANIKISALLDENKNFVLRTDVTGKSESVLAKQFNKLSSAKTRWNNVMNAHNLAFATIAFGQQPEELKDYQRYQFNEVICKNLLEQLDNILDEPQDYEIAKQLTDILIAEIAASIENGRFDSGIALSSDPLVFTMGATINKPRELQKGVQLVAERISQEVDAFDNYIKIDAEKSNGFSITKLDLPIVALTQTPQEYLENKLIVLRLGISEDAVTFALGLDQSIVDSEFAKLIAGTQELNDVPNQCVLDFAQLAKIIKSTVMQPNFSPTTLNSINAIANASEIKISFQNKYDINSLKSEYIISRGVFKTLGKIIRINLYGAKEDDSQDMDAIFEEE